MADSNRRAVSAHHPSPSSVAGAGNAGRPCKPTILYRQPSCLPHRSLRPDEARPHDTLSLMRPTLARSSSQYRSRRSARAPLQPPKPGQYKFLLSEESMTDAWEDCDAEDAICTQDGRKLSDIKHTIALLAAANSLGAGHVFTG